MVIDIIVEIPKGSRNKYELDKESGRLRLDRVLRSSVGFPFDYGFVPDTVSEDGDPLDVLVINRFPTVPGCVVPVRTIGVFKMIDTGESDDKIVAVPAGDNYYESWADLNDIPQALRDEIEEFFRTYKELEKKYVEPKGWGRAKEAEEIIEASFRKKHE